MKPGKSTTVLITNALLWATAMIGSSVILKGSEYSTDMLYLLLALSTFSIILVPGNHETIKNEWNCIQKFFHLK